MRKINFFIDNHVLFQLGFRLWNKILMCARMVGYSWKGEGFPC